MRTIATITRHELAAALQRGEVTVVDALPASYYDQMHLPGAVNLVEDEVDRRAADLLPDKNTAIVTYCSNEACRNSGNVAARLAALGYTNVRTYREGIQDWIDAGLPTESNEFVPPDVSGFLTAHGILRAQYGLLARAAREVSPSDIERISALEDHLGFMGRRLTQHHHAEDTRIWPQLRALDERLSDMLDELEQDHDEIEAMLTVVNDDRESLPLRAPALHDLHGALSRHLDREEERAVPQIQRLISQPIWALEHERFLAELGMDQVTTLVWLLGHLPPPAREAMLATLPPELQREYVEVLRPQHRRLLKLMYGADVQPTGDA